MLIHLLADGNGRPLLIKNTGAKGNERDEAVELLKRMQGYHSLEGSIVEADRGYDVYWLRAEILRLGALPLIPYRCNIKDVPKMSAVCERFNCNPERWKVERAFAWLKRKCRRLIIRWERRAMIWKAFTTLALIHYWLNFLVEYVHSAELFRNFRSHIRLPDKLEDILERRAIYNAQDF